MVFCNSLGVGLNLAYRSVKTFTISQGDQLGYCNFKGKNYGVKIVYCYLLQSKLAMGKLFQ